MSMTGYYSLESTGDVPICVHCGQCSLTCMFGATTTVSQRDAIQKAIDDPKKVVIFQTAPAVRVALGDEFGLPFGSVVQGKMIAACGPSAGITSSIRISARFDHHGRSIGTLVPHA